MARSVPVKGFFVYYYSFQVHGIAADFGIGTP
jgi:hypothetical protein